ncbi:clarin-3-like [Tribolium madens]|uniref:clarin-3-like n=1 Tax=Tribolium madens TaxID=41895 RepID=UPI001CF7393A|nr:clarin-3-like [Tribolium madens]
MVKTKREYIFATCFFSGAAAIISFVSLGTQEWITSPAVVSSSASAAGLQSENENDYLKFGLFSGTFTQSTAQPAVYELTTVCLFDLNICALLCGSNMENSLERLYKGETNITALDCPRIATTTDKLYSRIPDTFKLFVFQSSDKDRTFINAGVWLCTIIFLIISGMAGIVSAVLALWNIVSNPYQNYLSIFGLYIYNAVAFFSVLISIVLWGAMFSQSLQANNLPTAKTFTDVFTTEELSSLGYSYWINLASLACYIISMSLLYVRNWLISKEPAVNVHIEENADPVIMLY